MTNADVFLFAFDQGSQFNSVVPCFRNQRKEAANIETRVLQSQNQSMWQGMLVEATLSQRFFQLLLQSGPAKLEERQSGSNKITHADI